MSTDWTVDLAKPIDSLDKASEAGGADAGHDQGPRDGVSHVIGAKAPALLEKTIGALLADGIGDTIRVSLATSSVKEVEAAHRILKSLRLGRPGVNIIACPTCGRLNGDLFSIVEEVETAVSARKFDKNLTVALMGCAVNGPGEAAGADLGISLGRGRAHLFKRGKVVGTVPEADLVQTVLDAIEEWPAESP